MKPPWNRLKGAAGGFLFWCFATGSPGPAVAQEDRIPWNRGPAVLDLFGQGTLELSDEYRWLEESDAISILQAHGKRDVPEEVIYVEAAKESWYLALQFLDVGVFEEPDLDVGPREDSWISTHYDSARHILFWSEPVQMTQEDDGESQVVFNAKAFALGRRGAMVFALASQETSESQLQESLQEILTHFRFGEGFSYQEKEALDPRSSTPLKKWASRSLWPYAGRSDESFRDYYILFSLLGVFGLVAWIKSSRLRKRS